MSMSRKKTKTEGTGPVGSNVIPTLPKKLAEEIAQYIARPNPVGAGKQPRQFTPRSKGISKPKLEEEKLLPERKVPKGEKPNMLDVAGGAKTLNVKKGGLIKKKKSKKAGRLAKRGYGAARK
tara:strand:- start:7 stop:372 length:366 start_codon:yes stop_codon:yes gene_type:complete